MTILSERELKRHEYFAGGLLAAAALFWAVGAWLRAREAWVPEYPHTLIGLAVVMLAVSLVWRLLAFVQAVWKRTFGGDCFGRLRVYLTAYSACILTGAAWLLYEQRRLPDIAWARNHAATLVVLHAIMAMALPWVAAFTLRAVAGNRGNPPIRIRLPRL